MVCLCGCSAFEVLEFLHVDLFRNVGPAFIHSEAGEFGEKFVEQNVLFIVVHLDRERICNSCTEKLKSMLRYALYTYSLVMSLSTLMRFW